MSGPGGGAPGPTVFLSAGIPEDDWSDAAFQRHEIIEAVMASTRILLRSGATLVFGGHPLITPIIFDTAASELTPSVERPRIVLFQSHHFADVLPPSVWSFRAAPWAEVFETAGVPPEPGDSAETVAEKRAAALDEMRGAMLEAYGPYDGAVLVGGKQGIEAEYSILVGRKPIVRCYPIQQPGGVAARLPPAAVADEDLIGRLRSSRAYLDLARRIARDLTSASS